MNFHELKTKLNDNFNDMCADGFNLFETDADKDTIWALYLSSFPAGMNPMYRVRTEHDCTCCRHFLREMGRVVAIDSDLNIRTIFGFDTGDTGWQKVMDALDAYVKSCAVINVFLSKERRVGTGKTAAMVDGEPTTFEHYEVFIPNAAFFYQRRTTLDTEKAARRDTAHVFFHTLSEITLDAMMTVQELIHSNTLYKGAEWKDAVDEIVRHKRLFDDLPEEKKRLYAWRTASKVGITVGRMRNHSIGVLLTDISEGMELDKAVSRYEAVVAPANYKRPKAIYTKKMLEDAKKQLTEMGYMDSLSRRFATLDDINVSNILFSNKDASKRIAGGSVFDDMLASAKTSPKQFSRVEEISAEQFVRDVLPDAKEIEAFVVGSHIPNFVSLIAPAVADTKPLTKWGNGFTWAYTGNMADSEIRENVKKAGGSLEGVIRFSIQWNDRAGVDHSDLDAHCKLPVGFEIYFGHRRDGRTGGNLDVDITHPFTGEPAVENIVFPNRADLIPGDYTFYVNNFADRGCRNGFRAEIEVDGIIYRYDYNHPITNNDSVKVAILTVDNNRNISIKKQFIDSEESSRTVWGIKTHQFVPVSVIMYSPNYWENESGIGHRHYMFMLKGCVSDETPNGFFNEFLPDSLMAHKRVLEALGGRMAVAPVDDQLSGIGFSSTKRNELVVKVKGATERIMRIKF